MLPFLSIRRDRRAQILLFSVAFLVLLADQLSKEWVRQNLVLGESVPQHGIFRLTYSANSGIIFGIEAPMAVAIIMPILVVGAALLVYYWYGPISGKLVNVCLGLFVGGSLGNLLDRVRLGAVTDFIDVRLWSNVHWFTFNLADVCILVSVVLFAILISGLRLTRGTKQQ